MNRVNMATVIFEVGRHLMLLESLIIVDAVRRELVAKRAVLFDGDAKLGRLVFPVAGDFNIVWRSRAGLD